MPRELLRKAWSSKNGQTLSPWIVAILNPGNVVDFIFNMAMLAFVPCAALGAYPWRRWKRAGLPGRTRVLRLAFMNVSILAAMCLTGVTGISDNPYFSRDFKKTEREGGGTGGYTLIPFGPTEQDLEGILMPPRYAKEEGSLRTVHWLGTDDSGRDVLVRMVYGARISLTVGFVAVAIYMFIGIIFGALMGYFGGWVDIILSRVTENVLLFPTFFLILTLVGLIGPSLYIIMVVIGLTGWPGVARLIRGEFLKQRTSDYVTAARALGASHFRIIFRHILPNALSPAFVSAPFGIAGAIATEAGLSVLGFGVRPPTPTWGNLLHLATENYSLWWLVLFPSLAIFISVTVYNLVGSALRDAMDPRLRI